MLRNIKTALVLLFQRSDAFGIIYNISEGMKIKRGNLTLGELFMLTLENTGMSHEEAFDYVESEEMMLSMLNNPDPLFGKIRMDLHLLGLSRAMGKSTVSLLKAKDINYFNTLGTKEDKKEVRREDRLVRLYS